jgi:hypothetical protein
VIILGLRCECSATASVSGNALTEIDNQPSSGNTTVAASICPNCLPNGSFINFTYTDNTNQNNSFTFTSNIGGGGFPDCFPFTGVGGGTEMDVSAQGVATPLTPGGIFSGPANLSVIQFIVDSGLGDAVCGISLTANGHQFVQQTCIQGLVEITDC